MLLLGVSSMDPKGSSEWKSCVSSHAKTQTLQVYKHCSNALLSCASGVNHILLVSLCEKLKNLNFPKPSS